MGYVYLINIEMTDFYKIGITKGTIEKRMKSLQTGNAQSLVVCKSFQSEIYKKIETVIHRAYSHKKYITEDFKKLKGEWFLLTKEDVANFETTCAQIENAINCTKRIIF